MGDDAAHHGQQHQHGADADNAKGRGTVDIVQHVVHAIQQVAAACFPGLHLGAQAAGIGVQLFVTPYAALMTFPGHGFPTDGEVFPVAGGLRLMRQGDAPVLRAGRHLLQPVHGHQCQGAVIIVRRGALQGALWLHPACDFVSEITGRACNEYKEQHPANHQAGPGVQPSHALAKSFFHLF